jgi:TolB-like protein
MSAPPAPGAVRAQLERILRSPGFAGAARLSRFLRFVVERTLAGEADQLKEYLLGTEVFDRPADYDPRLDSIVRVEARRLRSKLAEFYDGPGAGDDVVIRIDKGSYVPAFDPRPAPVADAAPASADAPPPAVAAGTAPLPAPPPASLWRRHGWSGVLVAIGILAIAGLIWRDIERTRDAGTVHASTSIGVAIQPLVRYDPSGSSASDALTDAVTDGLIAELARRPGVEVASRTSVMQYRDLRASLSAIAADLGVEAIVEGRVQVTDDRLWIEVRLVDARRDRKIWVDDFGGTVTGRRNLERQVATAIGDVVAARFTPGAPGRMTP